MIYLDNSATTYPKPQSVINAVQRAIRYDGFNPGRGGYRRSVAASKSIYDARSTVKYFFGVDDETNVIFTCGCTQSLNMVVKGALKRGDHVVISSLEHNAVIRPLHKLQEKQYITYSVAQVDNDDDDATINNFRSAINAHTRMIVCTHASNVFGYILPVQRICALAHQYGISFCLDAAQSAGILDINMNRDGYDYVCCPGHKYLYGTMGIGLLLLGNNSDLEPFVEGGTGSVSSELTMPDFYPDRLEAGTPNISGILGLKAGIEFVGLKGRDRIYQSEALMIANLREKLSRLNNVSIFGGTDRCVPILSFTVDGSDSETVAKYLADSADIAVRGGLHCAPLAHRSMGTIDGGTVRIAPSVFTKPEEMDVLVNKLRKLR